MTDTSGAIRDQSAWPTPSTFAAVAVTAIGLIGRAIHPEFINDQLELLEFSRSWQWVYDEQMPVYAWVAKILLDATGQSVIALDALKYVFVCGMLLALAQIAERFRPGAGPLAVALAFLIPTVNNDLLSEVSHTAAQMCAAAVSAWLIVRALDGERGRLWLWLGLVWAAGLMAKHSMISIVLAEVVAVSIVAGRNRPGLLRHMAVAGTIMLASCAPLYALLAMAPATVGAQIAEFYPDASIWTALMDCVTSPLSEGGLLLAIGAGLWLRRPALSSGQQAMMIVCAVFIGLIAVGLVMTGGSVLRDRWLAAGIVLLAPVGASLVNRPERFQWAAVAFVVAACVARAADKVGAI